MTWAPKRGGDLSAEDSVSPRPVTGVVKRFEADARAIVPVTDAIGGTVIYLNGRLAYYVLNGEWLEALDGHPSAVGASGTGSDAPEEREDERAARIVWPDRRVSTS